MGANGRLVVGDKFPSHGDDYTAPHRTCYNSTRGYLLDVPRTKTRHEHAIPFFSSNRLLSLAPSLSSLFISDYLRPFVILSSSPSGGY